MDIVVRNTSSPGALFSENTKNSIIAYYDYCQENINRIDAFSEFRREVCTVKGTNNDNDRNVFPLIKNLGFILYTPRKDIEYANFFTKNGIALVKLLKTEQELEKTKSQLGEGNYIAAKNILNVLIEELIYYGLWDAIQIKDSPMNYKEVLLQTLRFISAYGSVNKVEFCYMLYCSQNGIACSDQTINDYRSGIIEINVIADTYDKSRGDASVRKTSAIGSITCYLYITGLLEAAGVIKKNNNRYFIKPENKVKIDEIIKWEIKNG